jgi:hypothetical protein
MRCLTIVRFPAPAELDPAQLRELLREAVPRYQVVPGLSRKYFIGNESTGGGVYQWESRAAAEAFYSQDWYERMLDVYGTQPEVEFFDVHALVDNETGRSEIAG